MIRAVSSADLIHLAAVIDPVIDHPADRHGIMDLRLILHSQDQICAVSGATDHSTLQNVTDALYLLTPSGQPGKLQKLLRIHLPQILRPDHILTVEQTIITDIRKPCIIRQIFH